MQSTSPRWRWVVAIGSAMLAVGALTSALAWNLIFDSILQSQLALVPGTRTYETWLGPAVPLFFEIYFFNWTNPDTFPGEKPHLVQLGPYRFREHREHVNVTWNRAEHTLGYRTFRSWQFDDSSEGSLDDVITTVDVITASAVHRERPNQSHFEQYMFSVFLKNTFTGHRVHVTKTARELLFEGYSDWLLTLAQVMPDDPSGAPKFDKFGWFYQRNNSLDTDGYMEVTTGEETGTLPGQIVRWNHEDHLEYYQGKCSRLAGSAGEFLPRNLSEHSTLTMFVPDLCRTVEMPYVHSGQYFGLHYLKFAMAPSSFDNSSVSSENSCFCNGPCEWHGVMNVSACRFNSPTFISSPHFLHADPRLQDLFTGLNPDPEKHSFYFAVEPRLGIPVDVAARFQLNIYMEPDNGLYLKVPKLLFPVFWVQQRVSLDEKTVDELYMARSILDWGATFCVGTALAFAIVAVVATCNFCRRTKPEYTKPKNHKIIDEAEMKLNPM
ncbi:protein peste-like [Plodia interpunctella]|uniref:protein peste-like n=1 Tax=Plodia interpunctella TaxID=58824 RepID=UPI002367A6AC|nr:protein peste-like [Plodia interpunctella]XP_053612346.1 protein peste-like [Plodia interpunctella]